MTTDNNVKVRMQMITKEYDLYKKKSDKVKALFKFSDADIPHFWALKGVDMEVYAGESIGLIGINGSGKSTLSNILAGIIPQTTGQLEINGETSIIAIGAGLKGQLTGLENIRLKCLMSGLTNAEVDDIQEDIIAFADLGAFIDQPVKNYSSGMKSRLGFAVAVHNNPDILIIDEALSVGDDTFYQKCVERIEQFKAEGKTIFFVSHSLGQIEKLCNRVLWMHYGEVRMFGETAAVVSEYKKFTAWFRKQSPEEKKAYQQGYKEQQTTFNTEVLAEVVAEKNQDPSVVKGPPIGKMSTLTKWSLGVMFVAIIFLAAVNLNGRALTEIIKQPSLLLETPQPIKPAKATKGVKTKAIDLWQHISYELS